jgi:hypothetical protein
MSAAMTTILAVVAHTPLWVWALFALVFFLGYQRTRDRTVPLWRMLMLPVVMLVLSVSGWVSAGLSVLPAILVGFAIGGVIGWLMERDGATRRLPDGRALLRGEWWSLAQVFAIVTFKYVTTVVGIINPALGGDPVWHMGTAFVAAVLSAMLLGRVAARLRVYSASAPVTA